MANVSNYVKNVIRDRKTVFHTFAVESSVAGVNMWGSMYKRRTFRLFIFIFWLCLLTACWFLIYETWDTYRGYPVTVSLSSIKHMQTHLPSVTICPNHGGILRSSWGNAPYFLRSSSLGAYENFDEIQRTCGHPSAPRHAANETEFSAMMTGLNMSPADITEHILYAGLNETLLECRLGREILPCGTLFFGRLFGVTNMGMCFTFNYNGTVARGPGTFIYTYGNYTLREVKAPGLATSLRIRLHAREKDFCMSSEGPYQGFRASVHSVNSLPSTLETNSFLVSPGFRTQVSVRETVSDRRKVENLGRCSSTKNLALFGDLPYTKANCVLECLAKIIWKVCRCIWYSLPANLTFAVEHFNEHVQYWAPEERMTLDADRIKYGPSICWGANEGTSCMQRILNAYAMDQNYANCSKDEHCPESCIEPSYEWTVSSAKYPPTNMLPNLVAKTGMSSAEEYVSSVAEMDVMLERLESLWTVEDRAMSPSNLFNALGGSLGLFLGISAFSIVELFVALFALFCGISPEIEACA